MGEPSVSLRRRLILAVAAVLAVTVTGLGLMFAALGLQDGTIAWLLATVAVVAGTLAGVGLTVRLVTRILRQVAGDPGLLTEASANGLVLLDRTMRAVAAANAGAEQRRREIERRRLLLETLLSALPLGVIVAEDDLIIYANQQAAGLVGSPGLVSQLRPHGLRDLVTAPDRSHVEWEGAGRRFVRATAGHIGEGLVVLTLADVTEARRVEATRKDFVAAASHELKTPAAAIQAGAETVLKALPDDPEAAAAFAEKVRDESVRLTRIVSDLLDLSRLEAQQPELESVPLAEVVRDEVDRLGRTPAAVSVTAASVVVRGNRSDLGLAVRNLLDNAIRNTPHHGHVWVRVGEESGEAVIEVADDGVGIPQGDLPRIFERFYRVDTGRARQRGGTGLGLAIVKHVAEDHGGGVEAHSVLGQGSTFRIVLPLAQQRAAQSSEDTAPGPD